MELRIVLISEDFFESETHKTSVSFNIFDKISENYSYKKTLEILGKI